MVGLRSFSPGCKRYGPASSRIDICLSPHVPATLAGAFYDIFEWVKLSALLTSSGAGIIQKKQRYWIGTFPELKNPIDMKKTFIRIFGSLILICALVSMVVQPFLKKQRGVQIAGIDIDPVLEMACNEANLYYDPNVAVWILFVLASFVLLLIISAASKTIF